MKIVLFVTGGALHRGVVKGSVRVTLVAGDVAVCTDQWEPGDVVIEPDLVRPVRRDVAGLTLCTKLAAVHILVTTCAVSRQRVMNLCGVTRTAGQCVVAGRQRKRRARCVIEGYGPPVDDVVAITALSAIASLVDVVPTMASDAVRATAVAEVISFMAVGTGKTAVPASKGESGQQQVVESQRLPGLR